MRRERAAQHSINTRARILDAAIRRFSRSCYEETGLRDIAGDVGVDVAYVHRCFGSKEKLFAEAVRVAINANLSVFDDPEELGRKLARQACSRDGKRTRSQAGALDIAVRSLSSPKAASVLRGYILEDFIRPLSAHLDHVALKRASLIVALLAGVGILRNVLEVGPLREASDGELEALIATTIQFIATPGPTSG